MKTEILFVLDRSGSMHSMIDSAISGFNEFLLEQQSLANDPAALVEMNFSLVLFGSEIEWVYRSMDIREVEPLTEKTYSLRGVTALHDAICLGIQDIQKKIGKGVAADHPDHVVVAVLTDGGENASRQFRLEDVNRLVEEAKTTGKWDFYFLGANQDAFASGGRMGFSRENCATYQATGKGTRSAFKAVSSKMVMKSKKVSGAKMSARELEQYNKPMDEILKEEDEKSDS